VARQLNYARIAKRTGYTYAHIIKVMHGKVTPSVACLRSIAEVTGMSMERLLQYCENGGEMPDDRIPKQKHSAIFRQYMGMASRGSFATPRTELNYLEAIMDSGQFFARDRVRAGNRIRVLRAILDKEEGVE